MTLDHKVAVITGGTGGIGFGIACAFVGAGANVLVTGRNVERGEKAVAELGGETRAVFFWACRRALKYMQPQRSGRIINISSVEGKHGRPAIAQYVAAKHGLIGLTKALAQEVGTLGITVNAICPGLVMTPLIREQSAGPAALQNLSPEEFLER
jgi:NAD(P)-dependent dehydrogenase (short-subunit alcohol dehydrogenase family)